MFAWRTARAKELTVQGLRRGEATKRARVEAVDRWSRGDSFDVVPGVEGDCSTDDPPAEPDPPAETPQPMEPIGDDPAIAEMLAGRDSSGPPDLVRDTLWVYQHIGRVNVKPDEAPSLGAWNLLDWAKQYRSRFFEQILPKAMAAKSREKEEEEVLRENKLAVEEIRKILGQFEELLARKEA